MTNEINTPPTDAECFLPGGFYDEEDELYRDLFDEPTFNFEDDDYSEGAYAIPHYRSRCMAATEDIPCFNFTPETEFYFFPEFDMVWTDDDEGFFFAPEFDHIYSLDTDLTPEAASFCLE